ncbi:thiamine-phosphate kinase [Aquabacter cavernae]|uniref:thiamine-phosphate kinase n=1 Tax=Aquabacter cavernae TaxID=2496029 RepID=UPI000F8CD8B0|nr:thiamine-phosphate kinase [Aquabacter cavernae]
MDGGRSGEDAFIARFLRPLASAPGALGLLDDAALLTPPAGMQLVLTKDALVAGVHFFPDDPPDTIARKALGVNLSDLAAKGAVPLGALLALAMPEGVGEPWMEAFAIGLGEALSEADCALLGGDTVRTPGPLTLSITALGGVPAGSFVPRTGARPDEAILVSGTIGDAALGLLLRLDLERPGFAPLVSAQRAHLQRRYLVPEPRLALAPLLRTHASAAMDVSDGLVGDIAKMLAVSGCGGVITATEVPLSGAARAAVHAEPALLRAALTGGDDYEIVCTVAPHHVADMIVAAEVAGIKLTQIGETRAVPGLTVLDAAGNLLDMGTGSYSHF